MDFLNMNINKNLKINYKEYTLVLNQVIRQPKCQSEIEKKSRHYDSISEKICDPIKRLWCALVTISVPKAFKSGEFVSDDGTTYLCLKTSQECTFCTLEWTVCVSHRAEKRLLFDAMLHYL